MPCDNTSISKPTHPASTSWPLSASCFDASTARRRISSWLLAIVMLPQIAFGVDVQEFARATLDLVTDEIAHLAGAVGGDAAHDAAPGEVAGPFEHRLADLELVLCCHVFRQTTKGFLSVRGL